MIDRRCTRWSPPRTAGFSILLESAARVVLAAGLTRRIRRPIREAALFHDPLPPYTAEGPAGRRSGIAGRTYDC